MESLPQKQRRSNRPLTWFACGCLDLFMATANYSTNRSRGDTSVRCTKDNKIRKFQTFVLGEQIMEITLFENEPVAIDVCVGETFEADGGPSDTVVERLNGLLDALGSYAVIPKGVRVFRDRYEEVSYLGRGEQKVPIGLLYSHKVSIKADIEELQMTPDVDFCND